MKAPEHQGNGFSSNGKIHEEDTDHHVPPRHPDKFLRFLKFVGFVQRLAYRRIFGYAETYEQACVILLRGFWTPPSGEKLPYVLKIDGMRHRAYNTLFWAVPSFEDACWILWKDWWTPPALRNIRKRTVGEIYRVGAAITAAKAVIKAEQEREGICLEPIK